MAATTVAEFLSTLPEDRRAAMSKVRAVIRKHLPKGYEERMQGTAIGYVVPHSLYPAGYHCNPDHPLGLAALASMKNYMSLHLMTAYMNPEMTGWLEGEFASHGKKLDMGKACIRFKKVEDLPLDVIGAAVARVPVDEYVKRVETALAMTRPRKR